METENITREQMLKEVEKLQQQLANLKTSGQADMDKMRLKIGEPEYIVSLAYGIACDLNCFLTTLVGNLALAKMYDDLDKKNERLTEAEAASMGIKDLIVELFKITKR